MTVAKRAAQVGGVDKFPGNVRGDMLSAFGNLQKKCNKKKEPTLSVTLSFSCSMDFDS